MEWGTIFATAFVVGFSGAMMPGPLLTVTIGETARRGFIAGPLIVLGHAILEIALILALVAGLAVYLTQAGVSQVIAVVGGLFLFYMGFGMARDAWKGRVSLSLTQAEAASGRDILGDNPAAADNRTGLNPVWAGILVSFSNPFWSLWWATVGLGYITLALKQGIPGVASFFSGHILADACWYCFIAAAVAGGRRFLTDNIYRGILVICGVFLIGLGGYFLYTGIFPK